MKSATFALDPPPGFRPFDPHAPVTFYHRRLPHWRQEGGTYFVTFRLGDSLPAEKLAQLESLERDWANDLAKRRRAKDESDAENKAAWEELSRNAFATVEHWLDLGMGHCLPREEGMRMRVKAALEHGGRGKCRSRGGGGHAEPRPSSRAAQRKGILGNLSAKAKTP